MRPAWLFPVAAVAGMFGIGYELTVATGLPEGAGASTLALTSFAIGFVGGIVASVFRAGAALVILTAGVAPLGFWLAHRRVGTWPHSPEDIFLISVVMAAAILASAVPGVALVTLLRVMERTWHALSTAEPLRL